MEVKKEHSLCIHQGCPPAFTEVVGQGAQEDGPILQKKRSMAGQRTDPLSSRGSPVFAQAQMHFLQIGVPLPATGQAKMDEEHKN